LSPSFQSDLPYIVMEWVEEGSIQGLLNKEQTLSILTVISLGLQIQSAMDYIINNKDTFHHDIKPDNIVFRILSNGNRQFLLTDFGISRYKGLKKSTRSGPRYTIEYAAPERLSENADPSESTEYYSLGVVLFECLSGRLPFPEGNFMAKNNPIPPLKLPSEDLQKQLPVRLEKLIIKLLSKKPEERLKNIDVRHELQQAKFDFLRAQAFDSIFKSVPLPNMKAIEHDVKHNALNLSIGTLPQSPLLIHSPIKLPLIKLDPKVLQNWDHEFPHDFDVEHQASIKDNIEWVNSIYGDEGKNNPIAYVRSSFYRWILFCQKGFSTFLNKIRR
jgi:serine/threonine protein kinase